MKKIALFTMFAYIMAVLQGCAKDMPTEENKEAIQEGSDAHHKIDTKEAKEAVDAEKIMIVGMRAQQEYREEHIPDAILVPNKTIKDETKDRLPDMDAALIVYCRAGVRSKQANGKLVQMDYKNVYVSGGISNWSYDTASE